MGTYIPHREGIIQTIVRNSLTRYQAYASPSQTILDRLEHFTDCADWSKGVARIRCEDCGHSYFRPFSCKVFHLCPSCDQKRTLLYAEYLAEDLLLDLPHRQFVFTIPKILRPYFKSDKRLFGEVSKLIFSLLSEFFSLAAGRPLLCASVVSYQSFGEFARFHPHWHVLVLEGGFTKYDRFIYLPIGADEGMLKVWQAAILALFLRKELINQARVNMLKDWKHSGFSIESETRLFSKADREALGQYVVRGATCAEKIQYDPVSDTVIWTASLKGFYKGKSETFKGFEFVDQLVAHLPPRRVQLVRRYGVYAGKVRKQWNSDPIFTNWHQRVGKKTTQASPKLFKQNRQRMRKRYKSLMTWSKLRKQSWARLLQKVYEVDPFVCPRCHGSMSVVAIIEDPKELTKIIDWAKQQDREQTATVSARSPPEPVLVSG
uniref:ISCR20 transposase n=1 Tax=Escherichia coli TaxID=562 RepID=E0XN36_ECOLX|nr:ISCR20 transposase [Escherichia coli]